MIVVYDRCISRGMVCSVLLTKRVIVVGFEAGTHCARRYSDRRPKARGGQLGALRFLALAFLSQWRDGFGGHSRWQYWLAPFHSQQHIFFSLRQRDVNSIFVLFKWRHRRSRGAVSRRRIHFSEDAEDVRVESVNWKETTNERQSPQLFVLSFE